jgi:hypothetical protein
MITLEILAAAGVLLMVLSGVALVIVSSRIRKHLRQISKMLKDMREEQS